MAKSSGRYGRRILTNLLKAGIRGAAGHVYRRLSDESNEKTDKPNENYFSDISDDEEVEILRTTLNEQRRMYDSLNKNISGWTFKAISYLGFIFLALIYLFGNNVTPCSSSSEITIELLRCVQHKLIIPGNLQGIVLWFIAIAAIVYAIWTLISILMPRIWRMPVKTINTYVINRDRYLTSNESITVNRKDFLKSQIAEYTKVYNENSNMNTALAKRTNRSFLPMIAGILLLIIMKFLQ